MKLIFSNIFSYIYVIFPSPFYALTIPLIFQFSQIFSCFSRFSLSAGNPEQAKKTALSKECQMSISYREESLHPNTGKNPKTNTYKHKHAQTLNTDKYKKNNKIGYLYSGKRQTILNSFSLNFRISCFIQKKIFQQNTVLKVLEMSKYIKP